MAEKIEVYKFRKNGQRNLYPWDEWLDGSIWKLESGVDFEIGLQSFATVVRAAAKSRGLKARTSADDNHLIIQAYSKETSEET